MEEKILAGFVLHNPEIEKLKENVAAIASQVERLVFVDNASKNMSDVEKILPVNAVVIHNEEDMGIGTALNQIMQYAIDNDYDWALPLDQATKVATNIIEVYRKVITNNQHLGMVCPLYSDLDRGIDDDYFYHSDFIIDDESYDGDECCIICASLVNINAWQEVGGFGSDVDELYADHDLCCALCGAHWEVYKTIETVVWSGVGYDGDDFLMFGDDSYYCSDDDDDYEYLRDNYGEYAGTYAQDVMGFSDDEIDAIFDGDPEAYWNID